MSQPFVRQRKLLRIDFAEGHDLHGLEIITRPPNMNKMIGLLGDLGSFADVATLMTRQAPATGMTPDIMRNVAGLAGSLVPLIDAFAQALVSWNYQVEPLEEGGEPVEVPATREGLDQLEGNDLQTIIQAWMQQVTPPAETSDLGKDSLSGGTFPESSLPMAPLSPSPQSLPVPA